MNEKEEFALALEMAFGNKCDSFSEDLRQLLQALWVSGVQTGLYARDRKLPVPESVVWDSMPNPAQQKVDRASQKKEEIIEMADALAVRLETAIDPLVLKKLEGDALTKGMHNFTVRTDRLTKHIRAALKEAEKFRVFEP